MTADTKAQIAEALIVSCAVQMGFRIAGVARTQAALRCWAEPSPAVYSPQEITAVIAKAYRAQLIVQRNTGFAGSCLVRTLTLWTMLRRRSIDTDMRTGMRKTDNRIEGHAWLEYGGKPLNESPSVIETYSIFPGAVSFDLWQA